MMQRSLARLDHQTNTKRTKPAKRKVVLDEINQLVPSALHVARIEPFLVCENVRRLRLDVPFAKPLDHRALSWNRYCGSNLKHEDDRHFRGEQLSAFIRDRSDSE